MSHWSVAIPYPALGDGWTHQSYSFKDLRLLEDTGNCKHALAMRVEHKYVSPEGKKFRTLVKARKFLGMPIVPKSSVTKSSVTKSSVTKKAKSSVTKKAKSSVTKKAKSSVKASVDPLPLTEYEVQRLENIARNQAWLREAGLVDGDALGLAKKVAPRATPRTHAEKFGHLGKRSSDRLKANGFA